MYTASYSMVRVNRKMVKNDVILPDDEFYRELTAVNPQCSSPGGAEERDRQAKASLPAAELQEDGLCRHPCVRTHELRRQGAAQLRRGGGGAAAVRPHLPT